MKRLIQILVTVSAFLVVSTRAGAQAVVIDPSQIAASAINVADQIDYAIDQIGELANLGDKLKGVKEYVDDVFGEDGIGGKALSVLEDLGSLQRLTEAFNSTLNSIKTYSAYIEESKKYGLTEANTLLLYLNTSKHEAEQAVEVARRILQTLGFTKKEKKDEIDKITKELEDSLANLEDMIDIEMETSMEAQSFCQFMDFIDNNMDSQGYVDSLKEYGTPENAARGSVGLISLLLGLLGAACTAWGYLHYVRGSMVGDSSADLALLRIGIAMLAGVVILNILSSTFGFRSL
jgi:hypothetical protein